MHKNKKYIIYREQYYEQYTRLSSYSNKFYCREKIAHLCPEADIDKVLSAIYQSSAPFIIEDEDKTEQIKYMTIEPLIDFCKSYFNESKKEKQESEIDYYPCEKTSVLSIEETEKLIETLSSARTEASESATKIHKQFVSLKNETHKLQEYVVEYENQIKSITCGYALKELAEIVREAEQSNSPYANRLEKVLIEFGCVPINPLPDETFDTLYHNYSSDDQIGNTRIRQTVLRGWKYGNDTLLHAEVETEK